MKRGLINFIKSMQIYQWVIGAVATLALLIFSVFYLSTYKTSNVYNVDFSTLKINREAGTPYTVTLSGISLPKGNYSLAFGYVASQTGYFDANIVNDVSIHEELPSTKGEISTRVYEFELKEGTDRARLVFSSDNEEALNLAFITFASDKHIYTDGLIWGILALVLIPVVWLCLSMFGKSKHKVSIAIVAVFIIAQILPFVMQQGLIQGIDTRAHMMRIEGVYYGLQDGQYPVVVNPEWNNSYGQIGVLYPDIFLYVPAVFRLLRMSQLGVAKLFMMIVITASGIIAYGSARTIFKRNWQIIVMCIGILFGNMRMHDMLIGGKFGGSLLAEMFYPLVVAGMIELFFRNRKKWYLLAYGLAGVFCCHVTSATVACIMVVIMSLVSISALKDKSVTAGIGKAVLLFLGLIFGTVACFLKFFFSDWGQDQLQWRDFLSTLWSVKNPFADNRWTSVLVVFILCLGLIIYIWKCNGKEFFQNSFVFQLFITATILLWMSTVYFPWNVLCKLSVFRYYTNMLQSGNRFLSLAGCMFCVCIPELLEPCIHHKEGRRSFESKSTMAVSIAVLILCSFNTISECYRYFNDEQAVPLYYDEVVGEVECTIEDYLPEGTKTEWYQSDSGFVSDETAVESLAYEREGTYVYYAYTNKVKGSYVEFPKFYYAGYIAEDEMAEDIPVYKGEHNRVRVYLKETDTPAVIRLWYFVPGYLTFAVAFSMGIWIASLMLVSAKAVRKMDYGKKD